MYTNSDIVSPLQSCLFNGSLVISVTCMFLNKFSLLLSNMYLETMSTKTT